MSKISKGHMFEGCSFNVNWSLGGTITKDLTQTILVDELSASSYLGRLQEALETPGVPTVGSMSPDIVGLIVQNLSVEPLSDKQAKITVTYHQPEAPADEPPPGGDDEMIWQVEFGCNTVQINSEQDILGQSLQVVYEGYKAAPGHNQIDINPDGTWANAVRNIEDRHTKLGSVSVFRPQRTIRAGLKYPVARTPSDIWTIQNTFVGHVNVDPWAGGVRRSWLCSSVNATIVAETSTPGDGKFFYTMLMEFQHNKEGWDGLLAYTNRDGNIPLFIAPEIQKIRIAPLTDVPKTENGVYRPLMYPGATFLSLIPFT